MSFRRAAVCALLAARTFGMSVKPSKPIAPDINAIQLFVKEATSDAQYAQECGEKRAVSGFSLTQQAKQEQEKPGAGVVGVTPGDFANFTEVLKDGFMEADCVKDYMYEHGDKFGNNKFQYKLTDGARVSIVHYNLHVAKADRVPMTKKVCFEFCRIVPDMAFFGITDGRTCYCAPYYKPMSGSSSTCNIPCEGDSLTMCGGRDKSTIWAMHMCKDTAKNLQKAAYKADITYEALSAKALFTKQLAVDMDIAANVIQTSFGTVGDSDATNLAQAAKVFGGDLLHKAEEALLVLPMMASLSNQSKDATFDSVSSIAEAEAITEKLGKLDEQGKELVEVLAGLDGKATHKEVTWRGVKVISKDLQVMKSAMGYRGVMYFVTRLYAAASSTCGGTALSKPIISNSEDTCATACDSHVAPVRCVGYQFFESKTQGQSLCFLFSALKTATYYQGCGLPIGASFLQADQGAPPYLSKCMAKLSTFQGTTLAVDESGKCKQCLRKVTAANRCYAAPPTTAAAPTTTSAAAPTTTDGAVCNEAMSGTNDNGYRGCQTKTRSARTCQAWASQTPHKHANSCADRPAAGICNQQFPNVCRNPDGESTIWCYTTSSTRWEYCDPVSPADD